MGVRKADNPHKTDPFSGEAQRRCATQESAPECGLGAADRTGPPDPHPAAPKGHRRPPPPRRQAKPQQADAALQIDCGAWRGRGGAAAQEGGEGLRGLCQNMNVGR